MGAGCDIMSDSASAIRVENGGAFVMHKKSPARGLGHSARGTGPHSAASFYGDRQMVDDQRLVGGWMSSVSQERIGGVLPGWRNAVQRTVRAHCELCPSG